MGKVVAVQLKNVYYAYGDNRILEDVSLSIIGNEFLGIIGPNGGGKTTLIKLILGLLEPDAGTIKVFGKSPKKSKCDIGYVPQYFKYDFDFPINVLNVVLMGRLGDLGIGSNYSEEDRDLALRSLKKVGMDRYQDMHISHLSGGQRQRVFIARALAASPKLLVLDEPVSSVDTEWQHVFYELLQEINKNIPILLVTHDISLVSDYVRTLACVNKKLYYHGEVKEGLNKLPELYQHPVRLITHK